MKSIKDFLRHLFQNRSQYTTVLLSLAFGFLICIIILSSFIELTEEVLEKEINAFDTAVNTFIHDLRSDRVTSAMKIITQMADRNFFIIACVALFLIFLLIVKRWKIAAMGIIILILAGVINKILKNIFDRDRPEDMLLNFLETSSYPSGHAMSAIAFYGFIIYIFWKMVKPAWLKWTGSIFLSVIILLIGLSRVYLGVHYPSDVLAGFAAGLFWLLISIIAFEGHYLYNTVQQNIKDSIK